MEKKHHIILYTLLGLTVLTAALFGVDATLRANAARQALQDTYIRHLLETQEQLQAISTQLAKAQIASDVRTRVEMLSLVSRQADGVVGGLTALPLCVLYAAGDEFHQSFTEARGPSLVDVGIDTAGALLMWGLLALSERLFARRRPAPVCDK